MSRRNYKVYADIGLDSNRLTRFLTILDTGAGPNFISRAELPDEVDGLIRHGPLPDICDANSNPLDMIGTVKLPVRLGHFLCLVEFIVCRSLAASAILGADYCDRFVEAIRPKKKLVELEDGSTIPIVRRPHRRTPRMAPLPPDMEYPDKNGRISPTVKMAESITIEPHNQAWVKVTTKRRGLVILQPSPKLYATHALVCTNGVVSVEPNIPFHILVANFSDSPKKLVRNQNVATVLPHPRFVVPTQITAGDVVGLAELVPSDSTTTKQSSDVDEGSTLVSTRNQPSASELDLSHVPEVHRLRLRRLLLKYDGMWDGKLGEINVVKHRIDLKPGSKPSMQRPYRAGPKSREFVNKEVENMLHKGVISPVQSEWASPVVIVPKSDGSLRFCVDYRKLNAMTVRDTYPLPRMDECIDSLGDAKIFSTLDCNSGYWQVPIHPEDKEKTTFTSHAGTYCFNRMPFGLMNAPATFQRTLDVLLNKYNWKSCLVYLDDVIIFSEDIETHFKDVDNILGTLSRAGISLKLKKCEWFTKSVKYLGHIITPGHLSINAAHTESFRELRHPRTISELRSFLGLCNVYRRFIPNFSHIAAPLNALLKKGMPTNLEPFGDSESAAFDSLINAVLSPPVLSLPKRDLSFSVDTDASDYQLGAALFQADESGDRKPLGFWSRSLAPAERNYSTSEKECLAVVWAVQILRPYLQGVPFVVHSDHAALRWLMEIAEPSGRLMRWRLRLGDFDFRIEYKKGNKNTQADALSRLKTLGETVVPIDEDIPCFPSTTPDEESLTQGCTAESVPDHSDHVVLAAEESREPPLVPITRDELVYEQTNDKDCRNIVARLARGEGLPFAVDDQGILFRTTAGDQQIYIPRPLRDRVLRLSHYSKLSGHPGGRRLYHFLRRSFYWPSMAVDCYGVAKNCPSCARNRVLLRKHQKEMKLFPATAPLEFVTIDTLGELIRTPRGNRFLLVITDRFSKIVRTVPLKSISAESVAKAFVTHWVMVYGPPLWLLSDNGKQFTARFFQHVCRILGIENLFTTTYHPQCNGQVERFNRTILAGLRHFIGDHPKEWDMYSDSLTYAYNTQVHRSTNCSPFELVLSRAPPPLAIAPMPQGTLGESPKQYYMKWKLWLQHLISGAGAQLKDTQRRYQRNFNSRLRLPKSTLKPGAYVFIRKEFFNEGTRKHKLATIAGRPFKIVLISDSTVVVRIGEEEERISLDRVVEAPVPLEELSSQVMEPSTGRKAQEAPGEGTAHSEPENPLQSATLSRNLTQGATTVTIPAEVVSRYEPNRPLNTNMRVDVERSTHSAETEEFVVESIVDYRVKRGAHQYRVRWYGYQPGEDTWEPPHHLPRSHLIRFHRKQRTTPPPGSMEGALVG